MSKQTDSDDLVRVGPGTVMGELMRQYWIPAVMSSELERDGAPMRLMLLGERLIGFRDSAGKVGVMDHRCPHRCASLFLGRNEGNGLRCVYHGWKFDVEGKCVDMPSVPVHQDFKGKVSTKAYRVTERAGVVWVYMGAAAEAPPFDGVDESVAEAMQAAWVRFAATGDPNGGSLPHWPPYRSDDDPYLTFDDEIRAGGNWRRRQMDFLDGYYARMKEA